MKKKLGKPYERILVYGQPGTGKTYGILKIAEHLEKIGALDNRSFYYIDTDDGVEADLREFSDEVRDSIEYYFTPTFEEVMDAWKEIKDAKKEGEWIKLSRAM